MAKENKPSEELNVKDMLLQKHDINKQILYGGMNALEFKNFKKIPTEEWKQIRRCYSKYGHGIFNFWTLIAFLVLAVAVYFIFSGWIKDAAFVIGFLSFLTIFTKIGHSEGYENGYNDGFEAGIDKAFGIDDEESADIYERAIEMEIDERLISKWEKEKS